MSVFEIFQAVGQNVWLYGGAFILVLSVLVFVHEWGHYIVARICGVRVEVFSIGFGKELFGFTDKHNTRWKFSLVPLGGYVQMFGDTDPASARQTEEIEDGEQKRPMSEAEKQVAFFNKSVWKRAAIVFAGPAINYIFAIILLTGLFTLNGQPVTPPMGAAVVKESAADRNGFLPQDQIISIDGTAIQSFEDIRREMMIALDEKKHFVIERDGKQIDIHAAPDRVTREDHLGFEHSRGLLGLISPRNAIKLESIKAINGRAYEDPEQLLAQIERRIGKPFEITIPAGKDETQILRINPSPDYNPHLGDAEHEDGAVLFLANVEANNFVKYPVWESLARATVESWVITTSTLEALGQMIMGTRSATELGGIIRIGALAGDMAQQGVIALILFTALLSINLGLINLFPIPMLDGGHLVFYTLEALFRKPVSEQIQEYAYGAGLVLLVALMAFANLNDIVQLFI